jgi:hypothetical protein
VILPIKEYTGTEYDAQYTYQRNVEFGQVDQSPDVIRNIKKFDIISSK